MAEKEVKGSKASPMTSREVIPLEVKTTPENIAKGLQDSITSVKTLPKGLLKIKETVGESKT